MTLSEGGTTRKLAAWAGSQNRQELWNVGNSFSLDIRWNLFYISIILYIWYEVTTKTDLGFF